MKRKATKAERFHMALVSRLGCIACEKIGYFGTPAEVHHVKKQVGWGRDSHFSVIPLCPEHHRGNTGIHMLGREKFKELYGKSELEMLDEVNKRIGRC